VKGVDMKEKCKKKNDCCKKVTK